MTTLLDRGRAIIDPLTAADFPAYLVGGAVRDSLMGRACHDLDITTAATPDEVKRIFPHLRIIDSGIQHGTVTLLADGGAVEVTTFRTEGGYTDHRRPDAVAFTRNLDDDLSRRDFTMNAIALGLDGIHDPFGGRSDIEHHIIRCVGDPQTRFEEDALRILRALRFSSTLDFAIEQETAAAIHRCAPLLTHVSVERIATELLKLLCGRAVGRILTDFSDVIVTIIPELAPCIGFEQQTHYHSFDVYTHIAHTVEGVPPTEILRLAALLHDIAKPQTFRLGEDNVGHFFRHAAIGAPLAGDILRRLHLSNAMIDEITPLIALHGLTRDTPIHRLPRLISKIGADSFFNLLALDRADSFAKHLRSQGNWDEIERSAREFLATEPCLTLKDLAVNGSDALSAGLIGPEIGATLNGLLQRVIDGEIPNEREFLLKLLQK